MADSHLSARSLAERLGHWRTRTPAYEALADAIRLLSLDGRIAPNTALPAERELAARLRVSRSTVAAAYASLRDSAHITSIRGSGSVTRAVGRRDIPEQTNDEHAIDLMQACPPAWPGLAAIYAQTVTDMPAIIAGGGYEMTGRPALRAAIAQRYTERGLPTNPAQILVTNGAQSAISMLSRLLVRRGDRVMMETPTYPHAADTFLGDGARLVGIPVLPGEGWDLERADEALRRAAPVAAYLMPDFQNPTGESMSDADAARVASAARAAGTTLIVDETTAELDIDRGGEVPTPFVVRSGGIEGIVTLGSLGKTVWGGLRIGWIRADEETIRRLVIARPSIDLGTPDLEQAVAERLVPELPDIVRARASQLREGRDTLVRQVARCLPDWRASAPAGGVATWIALGAPRSSALVLEARRIGLLLSAGPRFSVGGGNERNLRVPFTADPAILTRAVDVLAEAWSHLARVESAAIEGSFYDAVV
ncbi:MAG: PLP-dependent aminotransferase family protein [Microbacterium sp.]